MTNEKFLTYINNAIDNLTGNEKAMVEHMRKCGIKSAENVCIYNGLVGVWLETIRCGILENIETETAKKTGKSSVLSAVKKFQKETTKAMTNRPIMAYTHYDESEKKYILTDAYMMLIAENSEGLTMRPEALKGEYLDWKRVATTTYERTQELPPIGKLSAWLKQQKTVVPKREKDRIRCCLNDEFLTLDAARLELCMKITGATFLEWNTNMKQVRLSGNGYEIILMPVQPQKGDNGEYTQEVTNFNV